MKTFLTLTIAALFLASGAARAQSQSGCLRVDKIQMPHHNLQPGGTLNIQVRLRTSHCALDNAFGTGTTTTVAVEPRPGFEATIGPLIYSSFENQLSTLDTPQAHELETTIAVTAGQVPAGKYDIPVSLNYQAVDEQGLVRNESLHFTIPVQVVPSNNQPVAAQHRDRQNGFVIAGEVLLVILASPILILQCLLGSQDCWTC